MGDLHSIAYNNNLHSFSSLGCDFHGLEVFSNDISPWEVMKRKQQKDEWKNCVSIWACEARRERRRGRIKRHQREDSNEADPARKASGRGLCCRQAVSHSADRRIVQAKRGHYSLKFILKGGQSQL
ncbi:hypothetical protein HAX54_024818 [Datura stramonium]|uniref:Uncharacterized protein n=1 Tax=Datura stramonium TaxID=4076 RepID=A0ABS8S7N3_DATST|nr:hypothetical protein [Datura stramonium]